ncbi:hypothetical protein PIB30_102749 [Stylosanthes scabra]|uniref:Uncharacterized protein n=1 Tax=Stylosanthes scabra TaxID=79078 RepID=A0ABU6XWT6_9FABA|nr:hypothetical protein [Stylosanthes scabra]
MGPRKEIQKKRCHDGKGSSRMNEPSHPLASWFNNPQAFETFMTKWEKRRFVTPSASNEGGYIECYVAGRYRVISLDAIANLCGLSMEGHRFMGGIHAHESWGPYALQRGLNAIGYNDQIGDKQRLSVNKLSTEMRILHYLITYTLLPRGGNYDSST